MAAHALTVLFRLSHASQAQLVQQLMTSEQELACEMAFRHEEAQLAVERAAVWMSDPSLVKASAEASADEEATAMQVDRQDRGAEASTSGVHTIWAFLPWVAVDMPLICCVSPSSH